MVKIAVIGGGASGMMAAIAAASQNAKVTIIEHQNRVGKKILATGNGHCNFTNVKQEPQFYHSENPTFPFSVYEQFTARDTIIFFKQLGIFSKNRNGYLYPHSDQAAAVLEVLRMELKRLEVEIMTETHCQEIISGKRGFLIDSSRGKLSFDRVIIAAGGKAAPATGSDGSGYELAKKLGHRIIPVLPALVQLRCKEAFYKSIAGLRMNGKVTIFTDGQMMAFDTGEIQLTGYGISGIPVFQVSHEAAKGLHQKKRVTAILDFMPEFTDQQLAEFLRDRIDYRPQKTLEEFFVGLFPKKFFELLIRLSGLPRNKPAEKLSDQEIGALVTLIKEFKTAIEATNSFEQAQVCSGGVDTKEINESTMESRYVKGVYFAGEILDVDGECGGYNLQWAWSSGYIAGKEAANAEN